MSDWRYVGPARMPGIEPGTGVYEKGRLRALVAKRPRWHLSISHPWRDPTWHEIKEARYALIPNNVTVCMILPPREEYVNVHQYCYHLHEHRDP